MNAHINHCIPPWFVILKLKNNIHNVTLLYRITKCSETIACQLLSL